MDIEPLKKFGLTENEIKIYLAALKLSSATANNIAKVANIPRPTAYDCLNSLKGLGLISSVIKSGVSYFASANPNEILAILKEREIKIKELLPQLLSIQGMITDRPKVELYEGVEGLKSVIDDLINTKQPILTFSSTKDLMDKLIFFFPNYIKRRVKEKIPIKVITESSSKIKWPISKDKREYRETRFISDKFELPNAIYIYGNKISLLDLKKEPLSGIIIENAELSKTFRTIFNIVWKMANENS